MSLAIKLFQNIFKKLIHVTNQPIVETHEQPAEENKEIKSFARTEQPQQVLRPKCIYTEQEPCLSSEGFFTPCCWFDDEENKKEKGVDTFFFEHLNFQNFENVEDIFKSKEWVSFFTMLKENPEDAPGICKKMCGSSLITKQILDESKLSDGTKVATIIRH